MISVQVVESDQERYTFIGELKIRTIAPDEQTRRLICEICHQGIKHGDTVIRHLSNCNGEFHRDCLLTRLADRLDCPYCEQVIDPDVNHHEGGADRGIELMEDQIFKLRLGLDAINIILLEPREALLMTLTNGLSRPILEPKLFDTVYPALTRQRLREVFADDVVAEKIGVPVLPVEQVDRLTDDLFAALRTIARHQVTAQEARTAAKQLATCFFDAHTTKALADKASLFDIATELRAAQPEHDILT